MENKKLINKAITFIQNNPQEKLSLQEIADNAGFSLTYFDALFKRYTGYSPVEYARIYKLTRAALELRNSEETILDIALNFGYESPESFTRAFKSFYCITPSEYREKYSNHVVTWKDLSGKIAIQTFSNNYPQLKPITIDNALDYCFTHNPVYFAEDMVNLTVGDVQAFTIDDTNELRSLIYVSDYNQAEALINIVSSEEDDAIAYVKLLSKEPNLKFVIRKPIDKEWDKFDAQMAKLGMICNCGYDMIFESENSFNIPNYSCIKELTISDFNDVLVFKSKGGCNENHVRALQIALEKKGNLGQKGFAIYRNNKIVSLALPILDTIRNLNKWDIGAIFAIEETSAEDIILLWKYVIEKCTADGAMFGNANAKDDESIMGTEYCKELGFKAIARCCKYTKQ